MNERQSTLALREDNFVFFAAATACFFFPAIAPPVRWGDLAEGEDLAAGRVGLSFAAKTLGTIMLATAVKTGTTTEFPNCL